MPVTQFTNIQNLPIAKNIRITLAAGLFATCLLIAVIGLTSWQALNNLHHQIEDVVQASDVKTSLIYDMRIAARERNLHLMIMLLVDDPFDIDEEWIKFRDQGSRFLNAREKLIELGLDDNELGMLEQQREISKKSVPLQYDMYEHILAGERTSAMEKFNEHSIYQGNVFSLLDRLLDIQKNRNNIVVEKARISQTIALRKVIFLSIATVFILFLITLYIIRRISQQAMHIENEGLKFKALIEGSMDAVLVLDKHHVTDCNVNALRMFSVSSLNELNKIGLDFLSGFSDVKSSDDSDEIFSAVNHALVDVKRRYQWAFTDSHGKQFPTDVELTGIELEGKHFVQMVIRDVTERERIQQELRDANENLEAKVKERTEELEELNSKIAGIARSAGMADVASGVLHNVGNVLNSMNVSTSILRSQVSHSKSDNLEKLASLLSEEGTTLNNFLANDEKGMHVLPYINKLSETLIQEKENQLKELENLADNIDHVKNIVSMQQSYAGNIGVIETLRASLIAEDAIKINIASIDNNNIKLVYEFEDDPVIAIDKHKLIQILVNLISNAKYAVINSKKEEMQITVGIYQQGNDVKYVVEDNGIGIEEKDIGRIFEFGFKKRIGGHGYGLHHSALMASELGGSLQAESPGPGKGARFILTIPVE